MKFRFTILSLGFTSCLNLAVAKDARTVIASMDNLRQSVQSAHDVFKTYDGGVMPSMALGKAVWDVYSNTKQARSDWDLAPMFEDSHVPDILVSYHLLRSSIADTLETGRSKGPAYDKAGIRLIAVGMMQLFENERSSFQQSARAKMPEASHDQIAGPVASLKDEFQTAIKALA